MRFLYISLIIFLAFHTKSFSHNEFFTSQGEDNFVKAIDNVFSVSAEKKIRKEFIKELTLFWNSPETDTVIKNNMMTVCDRIHLKNGRPFPDYYDYINTIFEFQKNDILIQSYSEWHKGLISFLEIPKFQLRHAIPLYRRTQGALLKNEIYSTSAIKWKSSNDNLKFQFTDSLYIVTDLTTIYCESSNDTIDIKDTKGKVNILTGFWEADNGKIDWSRRGYKPHEIYANFDSYNINMNRNEVFIDSVMFYNSFYFNYPLKGKIHNKIVNAVSSSYPKFESYEQFYKIPNIQKDFHYEGGFSQHGAKFLGSGTPGHPAKIEIYKNDTLFVTAQSLYFSLRDDQIVSNSAEVNIHFDTDYIYHPGLHFKYMAKNRELHLIRDGEGMGQSPYFNTYHNISMVTQLLKWKIDDNIIELRMLSGAAKNYAAFESISYFREAFFNKLQGMDAIHPLQGLKNCSRYWEGRPFTVKDYAHFLKMPEYQVRHQIMELAFYGFIKYNVYTDYIEIQERLEDFLLFRIGKKDYDVITFRSTTDQNIPNAIIDLKNYDMIISGVPHVSISDRQNVLFHPKENELLLKRNRHFSFDGNITSGMIELYGNGFTFNYDKFRVDLTTIDSMVMHMSSGQIDHMGRPVVNKINNNISQLSGHLEIDKPDNKSGAKNFAHFPRLTSSTNSFVYYENTTEHTGEYQRDNFYFQLDPFEIDSVNFLTKSNIVFSGSFHSDIFPVIDETLVVQPDYSLGFTKQSPPEGYPIYDDRGTFTNEINLSNRGLKGDGILSYITSTSESKEFTFLPKETIGTTNKFDISEQEEGVEFPDVQGVGAFISFLPFEDRLISKTTNAPFTLYKNEAGIIGELTINPHGLEGSGQLNIPHAYLTADLYDLGHHTVIADPSNFNLINSDDESGVNFSTDNLLSTIDFHRRDGRFVSHNIGNKVDFTDHLYRAYISEFSWDMDKNNIYLGSSGSEGNRFVSTHRRQDSLDFIVPLALYDVDNKKIYAQEVKYVDVADARMHLHDGNITINPRAVLDSLMQVTIQLKDSIHKFYDATVHINGKKDYTARGRYEYINGSKDKKDIRFNKIGVNRNSKTEAEGSIRERDFFTFNPYFGYKGDVKLTANDPLLLFKGSTQMLHPCSETGPIEYVRFESKINQDSVVIPIGSRTQNDELENIYANFFLNRDSNIIYSSFLEKRLFHSDEPIITAKDFLRFNELNKSFEISSAAKLANPDTTGSIIRYYTEDCSVYGEGVVNMGLSLGQIKTSAVGNARHLRGVNDTICINTMFGLDFMLDDGSIDIMYRDLLSKGDDNKEGLNIIRLQEWVGKETAIKLNNEVSTYASFESLPKEHQHLFVFDDLKWRWDVESKSYIADGDAILYWTQNRIINRKYKIKANIVFSRSGNTMNFLIEGKDNLYYFFSYRNGMMQTRSSNESYNNSIQTVDAKVRKMKVGIGEQSYSFILSPQSRMNSFLRIFNKQDSEDSDEDDELEDFE